MKRSAQRIVAAPKAATVSEWTKWTSAEAGARLARNCGKPGFCVSKNVPILENGDFSYEEISEIYNTMCKLNIPDAYEKNW